MDYMKDVEYERLLMEQANAKQEVDTFTKILSVSEGRLESISEAAMSRKAIYDKGKKIIDGLMSKFKIPKKAYDGSESKDNFINGSEDVCFLYCVDDNEFRNKTITWLLLNPIIASVLTNIDSLMYTNQHTVSMRNALRALNKSMNNDNFAFQSQISPKGRLIGFRAKTEDNSGTLGYIGRAMTGRDESVNALEVNDMKDKINAIKEADEQATKTAFEKFSNLIKTMIGKFTDYSEKQILKYKPFLNDMKDKILAKVNGENLPIEMRNYAAGINNIKNYRLPTFDSIKDKIKSPEDKAACEKEMRVLLLPKYTDPSKDFKDFAKAYFQGGDAKIKTNINALNFMDIYNYCDNFQDVEKTITADADVLSKIDVSANQVAQQQAQEKQQEQQAKQEGTTISIEDRSKMIMSFLKEEFSINEDDNQQQQNAQPQQANTPENKDSGKMTIGDADHPAPKGGNVEPKESTKELNVLTAYKTVGMQVIAAQMQSANTIYNDYVTIMRAHVNNMSSKDTNAQPGAQQNG